MASVSLVPARLLHVGPIAHRIREADRIEVEAMGRSPKEALRCGLRVSLHCLTALVDGQPVAMMGVVPKSLMDGTGTPWLLGTNDVYRHGKALVALGPRVLGLFAETCPVMENLVWTGNVRAIRMLARWGFVVGGEVQEYRGVPFVPFRIANGRGGE